MDGPVGMGELGSAYEEILDARGEVKEAKEVLARVLSHLNAKETRFRNLRDRALKEMPELLIGYQRLEGEPIQLDPEAQERLTRRWEDITG